MMNAQFTAEKPESGHAPFRLFIIDGWNVYIGKNDRQNDELTCHFGRPRDIWMHVASYAGSHVVVRRDETTGYPPRDVLEKAASLAAWFSKARKASLVKVHYTELCHVHKPKSAPAGEVQLQKFKVLKVKPIAPETNPEAGT
jgi:predicted ribosome quality control (RQC) complex YloA/Tae2 family protein